MAGLAGLAPEVDDALEREAEVLQLRGCDFLRRHIVITADSPLVDRRGYTELAADDVLVGADFKLTTAGVVVAPVVERGGIRGKIQRWSDVARHDPELARRIVRHLNNAGAQKVTLNAAQERAILDARFGHVHHFDNRTAAAYVRTAARQGRTLRRVGRLTRGCATRRGISRPREHRGGASRAHGPPAAVARPRSDDGDDADPIDVAATAEQAR